MEVSAGLAGARLGDADRLVSVIRKTLLYGRQLDHMKFGCMPGAKMRGCYSIKLAPRCASKVHCLQPHYVASRHVRYLVLINCLMISLFRLNLDPY